MYTNSQSPQNLHYLRTIMDNIHDLVILIGVKPNDSYQILYVNRALCDAVGYSESEIVGKDIIEVLGPDQCQGLAEYYQKVITSKQSVVYAAERTYPAGVKKFEVKLVPVLNSVGECIQIIGITREQPAKGV